ncbi:MAG: hypothetical protein A3K10_01090 [Bacteroidetes bacterium RIFCSPLOWO2_12_FULL_31_6]|nr:MAG: hypothetical protein A3K10_01090 [Bacteroidetes bacterium RIFCSPLOWO2_12_FULL_31_6]
MNSSKLFNHSPRLKPWAMIFAIFFIVLSSCKKDGELYPEFNNENLSIHFTDTLNIVTTILKDDSIPTSNVDSYLLGIYNDSIFGLASASFYTEITLSGANVNFGNNAIIDSVVLSMKYGSTTSFYGNIATPMSIDVYRLSENLTRNLTELAYYSNESLTYNPTPLGSLTFTPNLFDTVQVIQNGDTTTESAHVRIRLSDTFGQEILDAGTNGNIITNNAAFLNLVNGLYITPSSTVDNTLLPTNEGAVVYYDINSALSTLTVFYRNDMGTEKSYSFLINSESKKFNHFEHNYTNTEIDKQLNGLSHDSTLTYVQAMGGVKTKLVIPNLKNLSAEGKIIINKAELIFNVSDTSLTPIKELALLGITAQGGAIFLIDYFEGADYFGGKYDETAKTYTFNIARHLQDLINNNTTDYGMYLVATSSSITANRSVINSFKHPSKNIKLNITYSKF